MADIINAIKANDVFELNRLLSQPGRYVNTPVGGGRPPLHIAVQRNRKNIAGILVSRGADVNLPDEDDCTPLMIAILNDNPNLVRWLIDMGAETDGKSPDGEPYCKVTENKYIIDLLRQKRK
ncbi:myotrophin-like [Actinia tenebrosa]|uniref:Myotrophin-like n=1 Tax=Actinia tenebrosa TaxID=6105 RepID=A0A6P8J7R4_ACTTE|nr:myotrophin-like [Actinia tenebrosa]